MGGIGYGVLKVIRNHKIDDNHGVLTLKGKYLNPKPGQFFMIDCVSQRVKKNISKFGDINKPFLKRPFSVYLKNRGGSFDILYKVNPDGRGTGCLPYLEEGEEIFYKGPLGNSIKISKICEKDKVVNLLGCGVGIAPITFLAQELIKKGYKIRIYFGVKELDLFLEYCIRIFESLGLGHSDILISSENIRSRQIPNFVDPIENKLNLEKYSAYYMGYNISRGNFIQAYEYFWKYMKGDSKDVNFICAPEEVMKYFHDQVLYKGQELFAFLEERMVCGFGVCCSCNKKGHLICSEGPCFNSKDIFN